MNKKPQRKMENIDLLDLFNYYWSNVFKITSLILIGIVISMLITAFAITPKYTATSKMYMVSSSSQSVVDLTDLNVGTSISSDYVELLQTRPIIEGVIQEEKLPYSYKELLRMTKLSVLEDTRIVRIDVTSADKKEAMVIANAIAAKGVKELPKLMETPEPHVAEYAIIPVTPSSPNKMRNFTVGALVGFFLSIFILTIQYILDDTLQTAEDVEKEFGMIPMSVVPEGEITEGADLPYALEEAINRLRINISFLGNDVRKVMIESADPNEGKSFLAWHLWEQMAKAGEKVLLIDADMRNSNLKDKYGEKHKVKKNMKGTSHYLSGSATLEQVLRKTDLPNADIIINTENIVNPSMLLETNRFKTLLDDLSDQYRYIFIDAPPLGLVSDGEKIGNLCDGAVLSIRSGVTSKKNIKQSLDQLSRADCHVLGVVLNRVSSTKSRYYSRYYRKGYGYGKYYYYGDKNKDKSFIKRTLNKVKSLPGTVSKRFKRSK